MSLLHHVRLTANELLAPLGFELARAGQRPWHWFKSVTSTRVCGFTLELPAKNPVAWHYATQPDLISQLGRLAALVKGKYPDAAAVDVGANVGDTACLIKAAADIPLICIEGDPLTFKFLQRNIAQFRNTTAHQMFLGEENATMSVQMDHAGWNLTLKPGGDAQTTSIQLTRLDDFMATQANAATFKLLKVDTEGFDCRILRGAMGFIRQASPVITLEYNRGNMDALGEPGLPTLFQLQELGYADIVFHDQNGRLLLATTLAERALIQDLHDYADCVRGRVGYLDITVFHKADADLAKAFVAEERAQRSR